MLELYLGLSSDLQGSPNACERRRLVALKLVIAFRSSSKPFPPMSECSEPMASVCKVPYKTHWLPQNRSIVIMEPGATRVVKALGAPVSPCTDWSNYPQEVGYTGWQSAGMKRPARNGMQHLFVFHVKHSHENADSYFTRVVLHLPKPYTLPFCTILVSIYLVVVIH